MLLWNLSHPSSFLSVDTLSPVSFHLSFSTASPRTLCMWFSRSQIVGMRARAGATHLISSAIASREVKDVTSFQKLLSWLDWTLWRVFFLPLFSQISVFLIPSIFCSFFRLPFFFLRVVQRIEKEPGQKWGRGVGTAKKPVENAGECERRRNVRVAMIKSSLLADLLEVLSKKRGKTLRGFVWLPFTRPLCLRPLGSYLSDAPPFILFSTLPIHLSCLARNPALRELWHWESTISECAAELWNRIVPKTMEAS